MAKEIIIIDDGSDISVQDGNAAVVKVSDATSDAQQALEEVSANHVDIQFDTDTNELFALWGED